MTERKLNPKQEKFCQLYATDREFFGNGLQAYSEAYGVDLTTKSGYITAKSNAHRLLTNADILARINELLDITLNDQHVDKQLALVVTQNADFSSKVAAIREYNKLKARIIDKTENKTEVLITSLEKLTDEQLDAALAKLKNQLGTSSSGEGQASSPESA